jgi:hypothetical protein
MSGSGWSCVLGTLTCTRSNALGGAASYPIITLTVTVADNAPSSITNQVAVGGGGQVVTSNDSDADLTRINQTNSAEIGLSPGSLQFAAGEGSNPPPQTFEVQNLGAGTLGWTATVATDVGGHWLQVPHDGSGAVNAGSDGELRRPAFWNLHRTGYHHRLARHPGLKQPADLAG